MGLRTLAALCLASLAVAAPQSAGPKSEGLHKRWLETRGETLFNVFKRDGEKTSLAYVENSGICVSGPPCCHAPRNASQLRAHIRIGDYAGSDNLLWIPGRRPRLEEHHAHVVLVLLGSCKCFHCSLGGLAERRAGMQQHVSCLVCLTQRDAVVTQNLPRYPSTNETPLKSGSVFSKSMVSATNRAMVQLRVHRAWADSEMTGPCHFVNGESKPSLNEHSWNNYANMLYVDQPIGTGFSYGTDSATSTVTAAEYVWEFLQNFYVAVSDPDEIRAGLVLTANSSPSSVRVEYSIYGPGALQLDVSHTNTRNV